MRVCVFGAGAVGGYLAAKLVKASHHEVSVVARGEHLRAIAANGLTLISHDDQFVARPQTVTERPEDLPPQDVIFVTLKAHAQPALASQIGALLRPSGTAVFVNNGIPWWWTYRGDASAAGPLPLVDPDASLWKHIGPQRALGCVVYSANEVVQPGVVHHVANNQWLLGEPDGSTSGRLSKVVRVLADAHLNAEAVPNIRDRVWAKLLRNVPLNSVCALTRLPVDGLRADAQLQALCEVLVDEVAAIAAADGADLSQHVEIAKSAPRLGAATDGSSVSGLRPSMLQDALSGRSMEVESILGQVQAIARQNGTPSPTLDIVVSLMRGLERGVRQ